MRRAALVIGCGDSDLSARIDSNWSEGGRLESVEGGDLSDGQLSRLRSGDGAIVKTDPPPTRPS